MIRNIKREIEVKESEDGSPTLFVPELDEHYHSTKGALTESMHVFINAGLLCNDAHQLRILEIGFGTGLNAFLTAKYAYGKDVFYHGLEKYPLEMSVINQLISCDLYNDIEKEQFRELHQSAWGESYLWRPHFNMLKQEVDLLTVTLLGDYDLVFFDAFAPDKQPEMWSLDVFSKLFSALKPGGVLTTYCAKGEVRRTMMACGFAVERLPGPPGKRQMMRATKPM